MGFTLCNIGFAHPGKTIFDGLDLDLAAGRFTSSVGQGAALATRCRVEPAMPFL